ncbi:hypothetical protein Anacy_5118 [Anabaena cylindrica PCC 7122]|uniref:Uncharacterized protein n=1 Tax=Anabaena cylindrica (strain ATCC 27899 / PCC 7122) TaxID=272123 RepID=K9ZMI6_ANACC|nr:hypothetical protein Anacy_5118 [Anabaena cylindrica PCC 7122]BAY02471.1 hypothetical protein NIES19_17160 [Anabaena cylindrica PCC 7122]
MSNEFAKKLGVSVKTIQQKFIEQNVGYSVGVTDE